MQKYVLGIAAAAGLLSLAPVAASASNALPEATKTSSAVVRADWDDCGPRCQYWRHRRWEARREHWRREQWRREHYGYGYGYRPYYNYGWNRTW